MHTDKGKDYDNMSYDRTKMYHMSVRYHFIDKAFQEQLKYDQSEYIYI